MIQLKKNLKIFKTKLPYIASVFFLTTTSIKLIFLCVFYDEAVSGMSKRFESMVQVNAKETSWGIISFSIVFGLWLVFLCLADLTAMATLDGVDLSKFGCLSKFACIGSYCSVTILSILIRLQTIIWAIVLTIIGVLSTFGVIFIKATNALCNSGGMNSAASTPSQAYTNESLGIASSCIDLSALKPVVLIFTSMPVRLTFCDSDRTAFCSYTDDDLSTTFFHCYMVGVLVLIGLLHFLINMVASKNRYHQQRLLSNLTCPIDEPTVKIAELSAAEETEHKLFDKRMRG